MTGNEDSPRLPRKNGVYVNHTTRSRLIEARKNHSWSQQDVADRLGTTPNNVSRWELGQTTPGPYFRAKLCELFRCSAEELGLVEQARPSPSANAAAHEEGVPPSTPSSEEISPLWAVPYSRNLYFTGRDSLLEQLHQQLAHEHRMALSQSTVLSGLGGIGKTQTAIEYAYRHVHDYIALFWIGAETAERLASSFVTLAETLHLPERRESDQQKVVGAVLRWLSTHQGWLLIFDNVEELEIVKPFVPTVPHGSVLFTTRLQAVGTLAQQVTVETMGLAEGTLFLLRRARLLEASAFLDQASSELLAEAESLVIELDFLPLAIDQAGAYMEEVGCTPAAYLELYHRCRKDLLHRRGHTPSDHPKSVATTWSLSFERIEHRNPAAADLLRMCAFLEPDAIPEELLQEGCLTLGSQIRAVATDTLAFHGACAELARFSLVQRDPQARLLRIHRLVQAVLKESMEITEQERWIEHLLRTTERVFPATVDATTWSLCQRMLPQAQMGSLWAERFAVASAQAASLLLRTAHYLREVALYEQAERLSQQVLAIRERMLQQEHLEMAQSLHALAEVYRQRGTYMEAEPLYQRALSIWEQQLGPEHPQVAYPLNGLANLYYSQGRYAEVEPLYQRALSIWEQQLGPEHPQVAYPLYGLANLHREQGQYREAEPLYRRALHIREQQLGPDHPQVAYPLYGLAILYREQGQYREAEPLYWRALRIWEQQLGPDHPQVAYSLHGLANLYREQGQYSEAEPLYRKALRIWEQHLEPDHPLVAYPLHGLANLYREQGQYREAESLYRQALHIREQQLGPDHPDTAGTFHDLAMLREKQGNRQEALTLYQRALTIRGQVLGSAHPQTTGTRASVITLLHTMGLHEEAAMLEAVQPDASKPEHEHTGAQE